jgi:hypothetical protein
MGIIGERPTAGMRLRLVFDKGKGVYEGTATTPAAQWALRVVLGEDVTVETDAPGDVAEYTRRVVRIAARNAETDGTQVPRVIQRWRAPQ